MKKQGIFNIGKIVSIVLFGAFILAGCGSSSSSTAESSSDDKVKEITVATGNNSIPFCYLDEDENFDGYDVQVVKAIDKKLKDYKFTFEGSDFPTTLTNLESGKAEMAAFEYEVNDERKEKFLYGDVGYVIWDSYIVVDGDQTKAYATLDDLKGKRVYATTSTNQAAVLENYLADNKGAFEIVYGEYTNEQQVQALQSGQVDATLAPAYWVDTVNKQFSSNLITNAEPVHNSDAYILFNKDETELKTAVDGALKELKEDGTIKKLCKEYLGGDYVPKD